MKFILYTTLKEIKIILISSINSFLEEFNFLVYLINAFGYKYYVRDLVIEDYIKSITKLDITIITI